VTGRPDTERPPAQNEAAEENVLGACLLSPAAADACAELLRPSDFYRRSHAWIFKAILDLRGRGDAADPITVSEHLREIGHLTDAGGDGRVHELAALIPATSNAAHYARIVRDAAILRDLDSLGMRARSRAAERGAPVEDLVAETEKEVFALARDRDRRGFTRAGDGLPEMFAKLQELGARGRDVSGVPTGFRDLDRLTAGFQPENLVVIAARPSLGKTAMALAILAHVALRHAQPVALFTLEMSQAEIRQRLVSSEALVESQKLRTGNLSPDDWKAVLNAGAKLEKAPIFVDDSAAPTIGEVLSKARQLKARIPALALVAVDYLQLMASGSPEHIVTEVGQISRALKVLAKELELPVVALSQLSRAVEGRHDKRPMLSDLRASGQIEQDADVVLMLFRDEVYNPETAEEDGTAGIAEVIMAKHRNGPTGTVKVAFNKRFARFTDLYQETA